MWAMDGTRSIEAAGVSGSAGAAEPPGPAARVEVVDSTGRLTPSALAWLRGRSLAAMAELGVVGEARVRVIDDLEMDAAHRRFCGVEGSTDVLTFDLAEPGGAGRLDADLLVCLDEAERRAGEMGHTVEREILLYIVHGMLHCLGHDDRDEASHERMHALEDRVLERIGVGATFRGSVRGGVCEGGRTAG